MSALPTWRGTRIEHPCGDFSSSQRAAICAAASCTDASPSANPGRLFDGLGSTRRTASGTVRADSASISVCQALPVLRRGCAMRWRAATSVRLALLAARMSSPVVWPIDPQLVDEPLRVIPRCFVVAARRLCQMLPLKTAHARVHETREFRPPQQTRSLDRLRHGRVVRNTCVAELIQADCQQRIDDAIPLLQGPVDQLPYPVLQLPVLRSVP